MVLTRHGLFGTPFQFRPMTVPKSTSGKETNAHINANTTMVPNGAAAKVVVNRDGVQRKAMEKTHPGNSVAVRSMVRIQFCLRFVR